MHSSTKPHKKPKTSAIVAFVVLSSTVIFLVVTAASARIGKQYLYSEEYIGWPEPFLKVVYEKAVIQSFQLNASILAKNYFLIVAVVTSIRIFFLLLRVKKNHERLHE